MTHAGSRLATWPTPQHWPVAQFRLDTSKPVAVSNTIKAASPLDAWNRIPRKCIRTPWPIQAGRTPAVPLHGPAAEQPRLAHAPSTRSAADGCRKKRSRIIPNGDSGYFWAVAGRSGSNCRSYSRSESAHGRAGRSKLFAGRIGEEKQDRNIARNWWCKFQSPRHLKFIGQERLNAGQDPISRSRWRIASRSSKDPGSTGENRARDNASP